MATKIKLFFAAQRIRNIKESRLTLLLFLFILMVLLSTLLRVALLLRVSESIELTLLLGAKVFAVGFLFDCVTFCWLALPVAALLLVFPEESYRKNHSRYIAYFTGFVAGYILIFGAFAEFLFFSDYDSRFNFIVFDYLAYPAEIISSIRQSFPLDWILILVFVINVVLFFFLRKRIDSCLAGRLAAGEKLGAGAILALLFVSLISLVNYGYSKISPNRYVNELAGNGLYSLAVAFRNNSLTYGTSYARAEDEKVLFRLKELLLEKNNHFVNNKPADITRAIFHAGKEKKLNVIVVVEESLSAEYLKAWGSRKGLTPNLDKLVDESIVFSRMYAVGTRTVRGLEAIYLGVPPLPGSSIIKRTGNERLFSWGALMKGKGYEAKFIYPGQGCFDNMNYFFEHNGLKTVDRDDFEDSEVTFENVWGVCDEDLFNKVIKESDKSFSTGKAFFNLIMTTSNHRPFTYPEGRIDIHPKTGRDGGVKYADYALGKFLEAARAKPWFRDTLFVIVADHCAGSAGKTDLPVEAYEIPCLIYAPYYVTPRKIDKLVSQIDIAPTVLGMLNFGYKTRFVGKDILNMAASRERAFISTHEKLGYLKGNRLVMLSPERDIRCYQIARDKTATEIRPQQDLVLETLGYYQGADIIYQKALNRLDDSFPQLN